MLGQGNKQVGALRSYINESINKKLAYPIIQNNIVVLAVRRKNIPLTCLEDYINLVSCQCNIFPEAPTSMSIALTFSKPYSI